MDIVLFIITNVTLCVGIFAGYMHLRKLRNLIGYHLGMNISMTVSTVSAIAFGGLWGLQFPYYATWVTIIVTIFSMVVGMIFGALVDYQTIVTGVSGGIMAGLMSPMIVMHSQQPVPILIFCIFLFFLAIFMLCTSVKV